MVIKNNLLYKNEAVVISSYPFLVEIVHQVHNRLLHVRRHKLIHLVANHFWHPALDAVAREICACCTYGQLFKASNQIRIPPTIKIKSHQPIELVAIDVLQFCKSRKGNIALVVVINHFLKCLAVALIRNKKAESVANVLKHRILPALPVIPSKLLSDNGCEFKGKEFEEVLNEFKIDHLYSTPYMPTSNGCVESVNRTVIELLKGLESKQAE